MTKLILKTIKYKFLLSKINFKKSLFTEKFPKIFIVKTSYLQREPEMAETFFDNLEENIND